MPNRTRFLATWTVAVALLVAGAAVLFFAVTNTQAVDSNSVQHAGMSWGLMLALGMLAGGASLMTPTVLFVARRRRFRKVLASEGTSVLPVLPTRG